MKWNDYAKNFIKSEESKAFIQLKIIGTREYFLDIPINEDTRNCLNSSQKKNQPREPLKRKIPENSAAGLFAETVNLRVLSPSRMTIRRAPRAAYGNCYGNERPPLISCLFVPPPRGRACMRAYARLARKEVDALRTSASIGSINIS